MEIKIEIEDFLVRIEQKVMDRIDSILKQKKTDNYVSVKEASEILKVHQNTIRDWVKKGKFESKKFGSKVFINLKF